MVQLSLKIAATFGNFIPNDTYHAFLYEMGRHFTLILSHSSQAEK